MTLLQNAVAGAVAGVAGGLAMAGTAQVLYGLTSPEDIRREQQVEPRTPFIVLAQKLQKATGISLNKRQEKLFEQIVITKISAAAGATYALTAHKWPYGWLSGGVLFGTLFFAVEDEGMGPAMGLVGDNTRYPAEAHLRGWVAHMVFGVVTAGLLKAAGFPQTIQTAAAG